MPTISEPLWPDRDARIKIVVQDFLDAKPGTIDASEEVLRARLFGLGQRGQDLETELRHACREKFNASIKRGGVR